jgi:hypothetical protein
MSSNEGDAWRAKSKFALLNSRNMIFVQKFSSHHPQGTSPYIFERPEKSGDPFYSPDQD